MDNETLSVRLIEAEKDIADLKETVLALRQGLFALAQTNNAIVDKLYDLAGTQNVVDSNPDEPDTGAYL